MQDRIRKFVDYYNHDRLHESLNNLTPAAVSYGRDQPLIDELKKQISNISNVMANVLRQPSKIFKPIELKHFLI